MRRIAVLDAPSNLGLRPPTATSVPGCAKAPGALRDQGLLTRLGARDAGCLTPPRYDPGDWRPGDGVAHAAEIAAYSRALADRIGAILDNGEFPVVLGGDCSILIGSGIAMHRLGDAVGGRIGLVFVDGHSDFRHPGNASYVGAAAGEDLALVTGRGQANLAAIESRRPYFRDIDVVVLGIRAQDEYRLDLQAAGIVTRPVPALRAEGAARSAQWARDQLVDCAGYWVHVDVDVLDPAVMPAVDAPDPGGIAFPELELLLSGLVESPHCLGVEITVFDPDYDPDGRYAAEITSAVVGGLSPVRATSARPDLVAARREMATTSLATAAANLASAPAASPAPASAVTPATASAVPESTSGEHSADLDQPLAVSEPAADRYTDPRQRIDAAHPVADEPTATDHRPVAVEATAVDHVLVADGSGAADYRPVAVEATAADHVLVADGSGADGRLVSDEVATTDDGLVAGGTATTDRRHVAGGTGETDHGHAAGGTATTDGGLVAGETAATDHRLIASEAAIADRWFVGRPLTAGSPGDSSRSADAEFVLAATLGKRANGLLRPRDTAPADHLDDGENAAEADRRYKADRMGEADRHDATEADRRGETDRLEGTDRDDGDRPRDADRDDGDPAGDADRDDGAEVDRGDGIDRPDGTDRHDATGRFGRIASEDNRIPEEQVIGNGRPEDELIEDEAADAADPVGGEPEHEPVPQPEREPVPEPVAAAEPARPDIRLLTRPLGSAPLLDSEPLPATRPGMLRPRPPADPPATGGYGSPTAGTATFGNVPPGVA